VLSAPTRVLVVEAKREGVTFELPAGWNKRTAKLQTLCALSKPIADAIEQVATYCQKRGITFAVATNGHQYIGFLGVRDDGIPPLSGTAVVFQSLAEIAEKFDEFWNYFSRPGIQTRTLKHVVLGAPKPTLPIKLSRLIPGYPGVKRRNVVQTDIQIVSELVLEDLAKAKDLNDVFLKECYCESGALSQFALVSRNILQSRYDALFESSDGAPTLAAGRVPGGINPELMAEGLARRPILLIGDVGVGKSSFVNYFTHVYAPDLAEKSIILYIDLGFRGTLAADFRQFVLSEIENQLMEKYSIDILAASLVRAVYWLEAKRFSKSIMAEQYANDAQALDIKLGEHLTALSEQRENHLAKVLRHLSKAQHKQVIIVIDNADQRSQNTQQKAFLIAQELSTSWSATVFVSLRPETFHQSVRTGSLSGYHAKAFTIAPPRIDKVILKRIAFGLKLAGGEVRLEALTKGVRVDLQNLTSLLLILKSSLEQNEKLIEAIDNLSVGNVRRALDFVRQFLGSAHVDTGKILRIFAEQGSYNIPTHEFMRALAFGECTHYHPDRSVFVNLFDLRFPDKKDHFTLPAFLGSLLTGKAGASDDDGWVPFPYVLGSLQEMGFSDELIFRAAEKACDCKLSGAEQFSSNYVNAIKLRINSSGAYHHQRLANHFFYLDAVVVDTPILDSRAQREIYDTDDILERVTRVIVFVKYLSDCWNECKTILPFYNWPQIEREILADVERISRNVRSRT
jgi:hypothetical protein